VSRSDAITIGADAREARRASIWLETACRQLGVPQPQVDQLALCLEEVLANIIAHGGEAALSEPVQVQLEVEPRVEGAYGAKVTVSDAGEAFDPLAAPLAASPRTLEQARSGGMGLGIIRQCSSLDYRREAGRNHLTFGTRWSEDPNPA
jgi:anti-sigma regulatory factor (Ser/Thr protein kinase)